MKTAGKMLDAFKTCVFVGGVMCRLFAELGGSVKAYGLMNEDSLLISAVVGNESTNFNYACVSVEKITA